MSHRGLGDRWLDGHAVDGVAFAHNARVRVILGPFTGRRGIVAMLMAIVPEPVYLVQLEDRRDVRVRQSELRTD